MSKVIEKTICLHCKAPKMYVSWNDEEQETTYACVDCGYGMKFDENFNPQFKKNKFSKDFYLREFMLDTYINPMTFYFDIKKNNKTFCIKPSSFFEEFNGTNIPFWDIYLVNGSPKNKQLAAEKIANFRAALEEAKNIFQINYNWALLNNALLTDI